MGRGTRLQIGFWGSLKIAEGPPVPSHGDDLVLQESSFEFLWTVFSVFLVVRLRLLHSLLRDPQCKCTSLRPLTGRRAEKKKTGTLRDAHSGSLRQKVRGGHSILSSSAPTHHEFPSTQGQSLTAPASRPGFFRPTSWI
mmetsp:Transcript_9681/g.18812  ORF Transcript_9681/g.18812 Transcript_9681/m.18812 type:complete len:139 (-) Transcript_9681:278-694(-)